MRANFKRAVFVLALVLSYPAFFQLFTHYQRWFEDRRPGMVLHDRWFALGAYVPPSESMFHQIDELENRVGREFQIISIYQAWGPTEDNQFPRSLAEQIAIRGSIPLITWEPWTVDFYSGTKEKKLQLSRGSLARIARGDFDFYIRSWARAARDWNKTFLLRPGHEMNNPRYFWSPEYDNTPEDFIQFWRHLHRIFEEEGARNVLWVWSPWTHGFEPYYPGGEYVDWVGYTALNYGTVSSRTGWLSLEEILQASYDPLALYGKPLILAEFGTLSAGGDRVSWFRDAFEAMGRFRLVKAAVLFNTDQDTGWVDGSSPPRDPLNWPLDWKVDEFAPSLKPFLQIPLQK